MTMIIGWAHTPFGKLDARTLEDLIVEVSREAIAHAGLSPEDIDEVVLGHFNTGFSRQGFTASLVHQADPALRFKPATRVENACATGSAALFQGARAIRAGDARTVLVVGAETMSGCSGAEVGANLLRAAYLLEDGEIQGGFAGVFGQIASRYFATYGDQSDALARIAAKSHRNALSNPYAHLRKDLDYDFCRTPSDRNPFVAGPLKRTDCSPVSDGAAAVVLTRDDLAASAPRAVRLRSMTHVQDFLPMSRRDPIAFEGCAKAWKQGLASAQMSLADLDLVETHDCFTIAELIEYEAMGLAAPGQGVRVVEEGLAEIGGRLPINPSGGLKAKGHPIGATGVSMHAIAAMQVCGQAPEGMQIPDAQIAGVFNMGGSGVANYVSILERVR
jgi:acetyl-CoA C-acetyltransferase